MSTDAISPRSRKSFQQELVPSRQERSQRNNREFGSEVSRAARRRSRQPPEQPATTTPPPATTLPPVSSQPAGSPTPVTPPTEERTLAERYVAQYEEQSGTTLSAEQRSAKISEVEQFYLSRQGRLDRIVFA